MHRTLAILTLVTGAPFATGCSLFFSTEDERRLPPPSTPEITIEPASPTTIDDLGWALITPSVGFGGEVEYDVEWFLGDESRSTSATLSSEDTTRGDVWTVRVTPHVGDRRGEAAEASVTIHNSPPRIRTTGFNHYRPITSDLLEAFPVTTDADGDAVSLTYRWLRNGTIPVPSAASAVVPLGERGFAHNDTVTLELVPNDGFTDGALYRSAALPVVAALTAWRPVAPSRMYATYLRETLTHDGVALDADDHRMVYLIKGALWELPLDRLGEPARLVAEGPAPAQVTVMLEDAPGNRVIAVDLDGSLFQLDLDRGAERWSRLSGPDPEPSGEFDELRHPSIFVDDVRNRVVLFGGEAEGVFVHPLSVTNGNWTRLQTSTSGPELIGAVWLHEPGTDVAFLVGGALRDAGASRRPWQGGTRAVWSLALFEPAWSLVEGADAPADVVWPATAIDPESRTAYVLEGASDIDAGYDEGFLIEVDETQDDVHAFDFASRRWRTLPKETETFVPPRVRGTASWDADEKRVLHTSGSDDLMWRTDVVAVHPDGRREQIDVIGRHLPYATLEPGVSGNESGFVMVGGGHAFRHGGGKATADVWAYDFDTDRFRKLNPAPDPMFGSPPPAIGMGRSSADAGYFFGGRDAGGNVLASTWQLYLGSSGPQWIRISASGPSARVNASLLKHNGTTVMFGGGGNDTWTLSPGCGEPCVWNQALTGTTRPPPTAMLGASTDGIIAVGGAYQGGPLGIWSPSGLNAASVWAHGSVATGPSTNPPTGSGDFLLTRVLYETNIQFLLYGGGRVWELVRGAGWTWVELSMALSAPNAAYGIPSSQEERGVAAWDPERRRLILFGGAQNDVWELRYAP